MLIGFLGGVGWWQEMDNKLGTFGLVFAMCSVGSDVLRSWERGWAFELLEGANWFKLCILSSLVLGLDSWWLKPDGEGNGIKTWRGKNVASAWMMRG